MFFFKSFGRRDWNHGLNAFKTNYVKRTMKRWNGQLATWSYIVKQNNHTGKIDGKAWVGTRAVRLRYQFPSDITPAVCPVLMACSESAAKKKTDENHGNFSTWSLDITWHIQCAITPFMTHTNPYTTTVQDVVHPLLMNRSSYIIHPRCFKSGVQICRWTASSLTQTRTLT